MNKCCTEIYVNKSVDYFPDKGNICTLYISREPFGFYLWNDTTNQYEIFEVGSGGDNWGTQVAITDQDVLLFGLGTIEGDGTLANPLKLAQQGASHGFVLSWDDTEQTWIPREEYFANIYIVDGTILSPERLVNIGGNQLSFIQGYSNFRLSAALRSGSTLNRIVDITQTSGEYALHLGRSSTTANVAANQAFFKSAASLPEVLTTTPIGHFLGNVLYFGVNGNGTVSEGGRMIAKVIDQTATTLDVMWVLTTGALSGSGTHVLTVNGKTGGWIVGKGASASVEAAEQSSSHISFHGTDKGQMLPNLTSIQRAAIASPANSLQVYDTDFKAVMTYNSIDAIWTGFRYNISTVKFQGFNGTSWIDLN